MIFVNINTFMQSVNGLLINHSMYVTRKSLNVVNVNNQIIKLHNKSYNHKSNVQKAVNGFINVGKPNLFYM